jgi:hypothetical protein
VRKLLILTADILFVTIRNIYKKKRLYLLLLKSGGKFALVPKHYAVQEHRENGG